MKKLLYLLSICMLMSINAAAQQLTFSKMYIDSFNNGINAHAMIASNDNGCIVAGKLNTKNAMVLKVDSNGMPVWKKLFGGNANYQPIVNFSSIQCTHDSCYVLAGSIYNKTNNTTGAFCLKINENGDTIWSRTIAENGYSTYVSGIESTFDSGFVLTGYCSKNGVPSSLFVAKLNSNGFVVWNKSMTSSTDVVGSNVKQLQDSGYIIVGNNALKNGLLVKVNPSGVVVWSKKYTLATTTSNINFSDLLVTNDGVVLSSNIDKAILLKVNFGGDIKWVKTYNVWTPKSNLSAQRLCMTSDSGIVSILGDYMNSTLLKTDSKGEPLWSKVVNLNTVDLNETRDHGLLMIGNGPMWGVSQGSYQPQIGIIKVDSQGYFKTCVAPSSLSKIASDSLSVIPFPLTEKAGSSTSQSLISIDTIMISVYSKCVNRIPGLNTADTNSDLIIVPNPSNGIFHFVNKFAYPGQINIFNALGAMISSLKIDTTSFDINLETQPAGVYYFELTSPYQKTEIGKLIILR